MKLVQLIEGGHSAWYKELDRKFHAAIRRGDFESLSSALGHDPDDEDALDPESLKEDIGWAWDCVREELLEGRGTGDVQTIKGVLEWLGVDASGIEQIEGDEALFHEFIPSRVSGQYTLP